MYKVFLNDRSVTINAFSEITLKKTDRKIHFISEAKEVRSWLKTINRRGEEKILIHHEDPDYFFNNVFRRSFKQIDAAGGVVRRGDRILFIYRNNVWDLPKGKIDRGETAGEAALREVAEECGIEGHSIVKPLPSTYHIYRSDYKGKEGKWVFKETFWFEMEYYGVGDGRPEEAENITKVKWFAKNELDVVLDKTYPNLVKMISCYRD